jgi:hypothetical protein
MSFFRVIVLMMEAVKTSETAVYLYETTRRNIAHSCHLKRFTSL